MHYSFEWQPSNADVFRHQARPVYRSRVAAIAEVTGRKPKLSTTGGTSDARFIKDYCPVLEFGLVGQTMHRSTSARRSPTSSRSRRSTGGSSRNISVSSFRLALRAPRNDGVNNPPAPDKARAAARLGRRRRGRGRRAPRRDRRRSICLRRHERASRPSSVPGVAGTSAPKR